MEIESEISKYPSLHKKTIKLIRTQLDDDDSPAHPAAVVSVKSLMLAFEREELAEKVAVELVRLAAGAICTRNQLSQYLKDLQDDGQCQKSFFDYCDDSKSITQQMQKFLLSTPVSTLTQELPLYVTAVALKQQWALQNCSGEDDLLAEGRESPIDFELIDCKELCLLACEQVAEAVVIQLDVAFGEGSTSIGKLVCTSLGGEEVLAIDVNLQQEVVANIRSALAEKLQISSRRLKMVTSNGELVGPSDDCKMLSTLQFAQSPDPANAAK